MKSPFRLSIAILPVLAFGSASGPVQAYPLDGYESTGIARLQAQRMIQEGKAKGPKRPGSGELMPLAMVELRMLDMQDFTLPTPDAAFTQDLKRLIGPHASRYGVALLDLSDRNNPRYAEWNGNQHQNPGSVGKLLVALGIFQALADIYPDDVDARRRILKDTVITADEFSQFDHHTVQMFDPATSKITKRPIEIGDRASLYTFLDWMLSPSSNSAAGMLQKQLMLMVHFGARYPVSSEEEQAFFANTPKKELSAIFERAIQSPVTRNGLDLEHIRQGSFFTRTGKQRVPGTSSYATPRSLIQFSVKMEQGRLVDEFSSLEIKRLIYVTERRIRYASSGILRKSAVYFKSGSLYSCQEEQGFTCKKYHGNKRNYMNSLAIIESPAGQTRLNYMAAVLSNVLRKNSAVDHRDLARAVHRMLLADHPEKPLSESEVSPEVSYGTGFIGYEAERRDLQLRVDTQEALLALGYEIGDVDGLIGGNTRKAIKTFQSQQGIAADGKLSGPLLARMREVAKERGAVR